MHTLTIQGSIERVGEIVKMSDNGGPTLTTVILICEANQIAIDLNYSSLHFAT